MDANHSGMTDKAQELGLFSPTLPPAGDLRVMLGAQDFYRNSLPPASEPYVGLSQLGLTSSPDLTQQPVLVRLVVGADEEVLVVNRHGFLSQGIFESLATASGSINRGVEGNLPHEAAGASRSARCHRDKSLMTSLCGRAWPSPPWSRLSG